MIIVAMMMMMTMIMTMMIAMPMMILIIILIYICDNRESNGAKDARATESQSLSTIRAPSVEKR